MKKLCIVILMILLSVTIACKQKNNDVNTQQNTAETNAKAQTQNKAAVTFVEIGSVNCIPCRMMQPVMEKVKQKYGNKVSILFYDVWTEEGAPYAQQYGIRVIPTQIFLDTHGKEFFRHEGYFPFEAIDQLLQKHGVTP